ncbi:MAG: WhiB family transcriptional regulator [Nakamurella sp.]
MANSAYTSRQRIQPPGEFDPRWSDNAACLQVGGDLFFSDERADIKRAKTICLTCPVLEACTIWALRARPAHGVVAGMTASKRNQLRLSLRRAG